ncbi:apolipoprotein N-acyltransferase [candidate division WOR-3 bacterium]|uniref:Apolipoprotein N-acyltransferase n=1 Tax=candidate division WOR-3 bacterium TaxID=2052148 RepID=A0A9D5K7D3_UNCW3|nr:apolipoprotein N-acyltransferase [candidate division WOR-3 bacterium]MBD3363653.1 apolipoprotein N-acyltransferase [candidate division WOR-3 bacterium]
MRRILQIGCRKKGSRIKEVIRKLERFKWLIAIGSGVILSFAFAPYPTRFLAFAALIPLLWIIENERKAFFHGWLFGLGLSVPMIWWIVTNSFPLRPGIRVLLVLGVIILSAYMGLFQGLFSSVTKRIGVWSAPLVWVGVEVLREFTDLAFPWGLLGYSMTPWPVFTQTASIWGVYGLSALIVLINVGLYKAITNRRKKRKALTWGLITAGVLVFMVGFGAVRLAAAPKTDKLKVALIQPNVPIVLKGSSSVRDSLITAMQEQTRKAAEYNPDIVVYPETATLVDLTADTRRAKSYLELADNLNLTIVTGITHWVYDEKVGHTRFANAATIIHPDGTLDEIYIKIHLAPFGETIPFENVFPFLAKIDVQGGHHYRGKEIVVYQRTPVPLSFLICYEAIFPNLTRRFVAKGSRLLCAVTNDVWFGPDKGSKEHAQMAVLRTVENGVPMIRAANNGISMIVDPYGRVLKKSPLREKATLTGEVPQAIGPTIYTRAGFLFSYLALAASAILFLIALIRRRRNRSRKGKKD